MGLCEARAFVFKSDTAHIGGLKVKLNSAVFILIFLNRHLKYFNCGVVDHFAYVNFGILPFFSTTAAFT